VELAGVSFYPVHAELVAQGCHDLFVLLDEDDVVALRAEVLRDE
jgi:hypothetical protein